MMRRGALTAVAKPIVIEMSADNKCNSYQQERNFKLCVELF